VSYNVLLSVATLFCWQFYQTNSFRLGPRHQAEGQQLLQGKGQPLQTERQQHPSGQMAVASNMENGMYEAHIKLKGSHLFKQAKQLSHTASGMTVTPLIKQSS